MMTSRLAPCILLSAILGLDSTDKPYLVMLRAYLDASKTFLGINKVPSLCVAGFVADLNQWNKFQSQWRKARHQAGIEYFHRADFEAKKGVYHQWSDRKRSAVLARLINLTIATVKFGIAVALPKDAYETLDAESKHKLCSDNPYSLCASRCVGLVGKRLRHENIRDEVIYVFETGDLGEPEWRVAISELIKDLPDFKRRSRIHSIVAGNKKGFPALDAADSFAWETAQYIPSRLNRDLENMSSTLQQIIDNVWIESTVLDQEKLQDLIAKRPENTARFARIYNIKKVVKGNPKRPYRW